MTIAFTMDSNTAATLLCLGIIALGAFVFYLATRN